MILTRPHSPLRILIEPGKLTQYAHTASGLSIPEIDDSRPSVFWMCHTNFTLAGRHDMIHSGSYLPQILTRNMEKFTHCCCFVENRCVLFLGKMGPCASWEVSSTMRGVREAWKDQCVRRAGAYFHAFFIVEILVLQEPLHTKNKASCDLPSR